VVYRLVFTCLHEGVYRLAFTYLHLHTWSFVLAAVVYRLVFTCFHAGSL